MTDPTITDLRRELEKAQLALSSRRQVVAPGSAERACTIDDCRRKHYARGWCAKHYDRWYRAGDPHTVKVILDDIEARFWSHVDRQADDECWPWTARVDSKSGYGQFSVNGRNVPAHRWAYEHFVAPVARELHVDHVRANGCTRRDCVNWVRHLEPVTPQENVLRGAAPSARNAEKTHCIRGHEFTTENTIAQPRGRMCRTCSNAWKRAKRKGLSIDEVLAMDTLKMGAQL
jgi:hypothetical protein